MFPPLAAMVRSQTFRADLYYRISGVELLMPPLRERIADVPELVAHLLARHGAANWRIAPAAMEALMAYDWPGNVRQLERVMERALALAPPGHIQCHDLPSEITREYRTLTTGDDAGQRYDLKTWTRRYARLVFERCHGNRRIACEALGISYNTLRTYLDDEPPETRQPSEMPRQRLDRAAGG